MFYILEKTPPSGPYWDILKVRYCVSTVVDDTSDESGWHWTCHLKSIKYTNISINDDSMITIDHK